LGGERRITETVIDLQVYKGSPKEKQKVGGGLVRGSGKKQKEKKRKVDNPPERMVEKESVALMGGHFPEGVGKNQKEKRRSGSEMKERHKSGGKGTKCYAIP